MCVADNLVILKLGGDGEHWYTFIPYVYIYELQLLLNNLPVPGKWIVGALGDPSGFGNSLLVCWSNIYGCLIPTQTWVMQTCSSFCSSSFQQWHACRCGSHPSPQSSRPSAVPTTLLIIVPPMGCCGDSVWRSVVIVQVPLHLPYIPIKENLFVPQTCPHTFYLAAWCHLIFDYCFTDRCGYVCSVDMCAAFMWFRFMPATCGGRIDVICWR